MAVRLRAIDAAVARESDDARDVGLSGVGANHVPWRIAEHRVESGVSETSPVAVEEHFREFELPMKETASAGDRVRTTQILRHQTIGQSALAGEHSIRQRAECTWRWRIAV